MTANLDFETITLKNGLTVNLLLRNTIPTVTMNLKVSAGVLFEKEDEEGLANLTAELLELGTKDFGAEELSEEIDFMGAGFGSSADKDETDLGFDVLTKDLDKGLYYFSQIVVHPTFPQEEIDQKKQEIIADLGRQNEEPGLIARKAFMKEIYKTHPYSHFSEGTVESISKINREAITAFYKRNYLPNTSHLTVVGSFDREKLLEMLNKYFGVWESGEAVALSKKPEALVKAGVNIIHKDISQANIYFGHLGVERSNPDYFKLVVMNYILGGGGFASRMLKDLRDNKGLTYGVYSRFSSPLEQGTFVVSIKTKNKSALESLQGIRYHMKKIQEEEVTDQEYTEALAYLTGSFPLRVDTNRKMAGILGSMSFYDLGSDYLNTYIEKLRAVTKKDIQEVSQKYLKPDLYKIVIVGNEKELHAEQILKEFQ